VVVVVAIAVYFGTRAPTEHYTRFHSTVAR